MEDFFGHANSLLLAWWQVDAKPLCWVVSLFPSVRSGKTGNGESSRS